MNSMKSLTTLLVISTIITVVLCQRSPYAGSRPMGYKDRFRPKSNDTATTDNEIVNRFGQGDLDATQKPPIQGIDIVYGEPIRNNQGIQSQSSTPNFQTTTGNRQQQQPPSRIPYDAYGDIELVNRVSNFPIDHQPFWLINYQAIEAHRNGTSTNNLSSVNTRSSFLGK